MPEDIKPFQQCEQAVVRAEQYRLLPTVVLRVHLQCLVWLLPRFEELAVHPTQKMVVKTSAHSTPLGLTALPFLAQLLEIRVKKNPFRTDCTPYFGTLLGIRFKKNPFTTAAPFWGQIDWNWSKVGPTTGVGFSKA